RGLEEARNLDAVFMDKTGTLTRGEFRVVDITPTSGMTADEVLGMAAAVERESEHPIAQGVVATAVERRLTLPLISNFSSIPGHGVEALVDGHTVGLGGPAMLRKAGAQLPAELAAAVER